MAIEFVGSTTATDGNNTNATFNLPTTGLTGGSDTQARTGDLLIVLSGWASTTDGNPGVTDTTLTWNEVADLYANDTNDANMSVAWAHASVAPPANITVSKTTAVDHSAGAILYVFRGHDSASPMDVAATTATGTNGTAADPPTITPATTGAVAVALGLAAINNTSGVTFTAGPTNYSGFVAFNSTNGTTRDCIGGAAYRTGRTASVAENPGAFTASGTSTSNSWAAVTIAIRPAKAITADAGSYSMTGSAAGVKHGWVVAAGTGSYALTGSDAAITKLTSKTVVAGAGSYSMSGSVALVKHGWLAAAGAGSMALTGSPAGVVKGWLVLAGTASYDMVGQDVAITKSTAAVSTGGPGGWSDVQHVSDTRWEGVRAAREAAREAFRDLPASRVAKRKEAALRASEAVAEVASAVKSTAGQKPAPISVQDTLIEQLTLLQAELAGLIEADRIAKAEAREAELHWQMIEREIAAQLATEEELMVVLALAL